MKERIKEIRSELNMTQEQFADATQKTRGAIASYETGRVIPDGTFVELLVVKYGYNREWILDGTLPKKVKQELGVEMGKFAASAVKNKKEEVDHYCSHFFDGWSEVDRFIFYELMHREFPQLPRPDDEN